MLSIRQRVCQTVPTWQLCGDKRIDGPAASSILQLLLLCCTAAMLLFLLLLLLLQCYKVIYGYMGFAMFNVFFFLTGALIIQLLRLSGVHMDLVSFCFLLFNFSVGALCASSNTCVQVTVRLKRGRTQTAALSRGAFE
jgi:hypothetical protein